MAWQEVIEGSSVWVYEYVANGYKANAIAILLDKNALVIVSPPIGMSEADFAEIDAKGQVTALIAPHSGHDLCDRAAG
jgi:acyl CoA:acetate/3-ketoacid CoA transferase alpha subunit